MPLHPAVVHFAVAAPFFAAFALALAVLRPGTRSAALPAAVLLLVATVGAGLVGAFTGWLWADGLAYLAGGWGPLPGPEAAAGFARRHALLGLGSLAAAALALGLALRARRRDTPPGLALLATLLACTLVAAAGHAGGTMVHRSPAATR